MADLASTYEHDTMLSSMVYEEHSEQWAWKRSCAGLKNRQEKAETLHHTHSSKEVLSIVDCNARLKHNHQSMASRKFNFNMGSKVSVRPSYKTVDSADDMYKQFDSSENSDVMDEGDETVGVRKAPACKNLMSERKRRKKLNERLFSLRALVPNISKNLQNRVDKIQEDIVDLETRKEGAAVVGSGDEDPRRNYSIVSFQKKIKKEHRIVEFEVSQMEEHIYHLRIHCKKTPGVLVQLTRALEALELEILNANISSVDDHILNTVVVEVRNGLVMRSEELRNMARAVIPKFGFAFN